MYRFIPHFNVSAGMGRAVGTVTGVCRYMGSDSVSRIVVS